jgi:hypothetical protein
MQYRSLLSSLSKFGGLGQSNHFGAVLALSSSLVLAACGGGNGNSVTENNLTDHPGADGSAPTLTVVTLTTVESGIQFAKLGETVKISFTASESLMKPSVTINGEEAEVNGGNKGWSATRQMGESDTDGMVTFSISYEDVSGEAGTAVSTSTLASNDDGSVGSWAGVEYCADGSCVVVPVVESLLDFEDNLLSYSWRDIGTPSGDTEQGILSELVIDPDDATNTVAKSSIEAGGKPWAGAYLVVGEKASPDFSLFLNANDAVVAVRVRPDSAGTKVQLKLELATNNQIGVVAQAITTVSDEWETLYFDFSDPIEGSIDPAVEYGGIFMIWGGITAGKSAATWYWDDIKHGGVNAPDVVAGATISVPVNFEAAAVDYNFIPFNGGSAEVIANPDASGINTSANVMKYVKDTGETWGGFSLSLDTAIDFSAGDVFSVKVWSSAAKPVLFKLDGTNVEREVTTAGGSAWETLVFDFSDTAWGASDKKITVIADNGVMGDGSEAFTFYIDDIVLGGAPIGLPVNFEATGYNLIPFDGGSAEVIANPDASGVNTSSSVLKYVKSNGQPWGGFSMTVDTVIAAADGQYFTVDVWSSAAKPLLFKLDDSSVEVSVTTAGGSAWETLVFDLSTATLSGDSKITMIADNGNMGDGTDAFTFYIDNIKQAASAPVGLPVGFEATGYNLIPFDGGSAEVIANPDASGLNTSGNVLKYVKSNGQPWGGFSMTVDTVIAAADGQYFTVDVWSSAAKPLLFKLDDSSVEVSVTTAGGSAWETLVFDLSTATLSGDSKITMIADNGNMGDGTDAFTFYIDNIKQAASAPVGLPVGFEATGYNLIPFDGGSAEVIANPDASGLNTSGNVLKYVKSNGQPWGGFSMTVDTVIAAADGQYFSVDVWSSAAKPLLFKLDDSSVEVSVTTAGGSSWETLVFDLSTATLSGDSKITMIADNGNMGDGTDAFTFYIDNIVQAE